MNQYLILVSTRRESIFFKYVIGILIKVRVYVVEILMIRILKLGENHVASILRPTELNEYSQAAVSVAAI